MRERHPGESVNIGFSTHTGTVTAASDWGDPPERKRVRPSLPGSYEQVFHAVGMPGFLLGLRDGDLVTALTEPRLERAIGVVYRPDTERLSHYFYADMPSQFDAVIHFDQTRAVEPLERPQRWDVIQDRYRGDGEPGLAGELPETYPTGV